MKNDVRDEQAIEDGILLVREGHGANCSSVGSVIDTLFASAVVGGAVFAAIAAAMAREEIRVVSPHSDSPKDAPADAPSADQKDQP